MLRLEFTPADLAGVRFAHSPMAEVVASSVALTRPDQYWMYAAWRAQVAPALAAARLTTFTAVLARPNGWIPDFLTPVPPVARPLLRDELAEVAATPLDRVAHEVDHTWQGVSSVPPEITRFGADPAGALAVLLREIRQYFAVAVAPYWARLRSAAEAEIAHRARTAAEHGSRSLVRDLHPTLTWDGSALSIGHGGDVAGFGRDGKGLALLPSGFTGPKVFAMTESRHGRALWYPPRGFGTLWDSPARAEPSAALAALLGPTRAAVLTLLDVPHSTGEVASALGLAAATASHHLTTLRDAGLVAGARTGRRLCYLRTGLGEQLGGATG
ncbi:winged helix-turn-helix domain-containing protein [Actinoplanes sp. NPDC026623]|uniref:ArsR/SmtB family transcription factor n=1 Tax=Actinoplanes sp. NPDC026623 TaxID=3155610 RepID=UPI0033E90555